MAQRIKAVSYGIQDNPAETLSGLGRPGVVSIKYTIQFALTSGLRCLLGERAAEFPDCRHGQWDTARLHVTVSRCALLDSIRGMGLLAWWSNRISKWTDRTYPHIAKVGHGK